MEGDVFIPSQVRMKTGAQFKQGADTALALDVPFSRRSDSDDHAEQGALPRPVPAQDAHGLAAIDGEAYAPQSPEIIAGMFESGDCFLGEEIPLAVPVIALADVLETKYSHCAFEDRTCARRIACERA